MSGNPAKRDIAVDKLRILVANSKIAFANVGGIPPLIRLLSTGGRTALVLWNLAFNDTNKILIEKGGGIPPLIGLLSGSEVEKERAVEALWILACYDNNKEVIAKEGGITPLIRILMSTGSNTLKEKA